MSRIHCFIFFLFTFISSFAQNSESLPKPFQAQNQQFGYRDANQQILIEAQFEDALPFVGNYAFVKKNNAWGVINTKGKEVIPASYEGIGWTLPNDRSIIMSGEILGYKKTGKWGLISIKNKVISSPKYHILQPFANDKIKVGQISTSSVTDTLYGIIDIQGKEIIPIKYHVLETTSKDGVLLVGSNKIYNSIPSGAIQSSTKSYGLINLSNIPILPLEYKNIKINDRGMEITPFDSWKLVGGKDSTLAIYTLDSIYAVSPNQYAFINSGKTGLIEETVILYANKDAIQPVQKGFVKYKSGEKYGVLISEASTLKTFLPPMYDSIALDTEEFVRAGVLEGKRWNWEIIKRQSNNKSIITQQPYSWIEAITHNPLMQVKNNNLYGYINKEGVEVIPLQFDSLGKFIDSLCVAVYKKKYGILKKNGKWLFEPKADYFAVNQFGYFIRKMNGRYEVLDISGKVRHTSAEPLQFVADGSISFKQKGKYGRISRTGTPCVPAVYDSVSPMTTDGTFWTFLNKNIYLYKNNGELLIKPGSGIEKITYVPEHEFIPARIGGKYGFVDGFGRLRIANQYENVRPFDKNLAAVKFAGKWGFITKQEKIAVQPYYDEVFSFENDKAIARKGDKYGMIDNKGKIVTPFSFDKIIRHTSGNYVVEAKGKQGMLNKKGFEVVYAKYDQVIPQEDDKAIVKLNNQYGLLDEKGISILPAAYDKIIKNPFSATYLAYKKSHSYTLNPGDLKDKSALK